MTSTQQIEKEIQNFAKDTFYSIWATLYLKTKDIIRIKVPADTNQVEAKEFLKETLERAIKNKQKDFEPEAILTLTKITITAVSPEKIKMSTKELEEETKKEGKIAGRHIIDREVIKNDKIRKFLAKIEKHVEETGYAEYVVIIAGLYRPEQKRPLIRLMLLHELENSVKILEDTGFTEIEETENLAIKTMINENPLIELFYGVKQDEEISFLEEVTANEIETFAESGKKYTILAGKYFREEGTLKILDLYGLAQLSLSIEKRMNPEEEQIDPKVLADFALDLVKEAEKEGTETDYLIALNKVEIKRLRELLTGANIRDARLKAIIELLKTLDNKDYIAIITTLYSFKDKRTWVKLALHHRLTMVLQEDSGLISLDEEDEKVQKAFCKIEPLLSHLKKKVIVDARGN